MKFESMIQRQFVIWLIRAALKMTAIVVGAGLTWALFSVNPFFIMIVLMIAIPLALGAVA